MFTKADLQNGDFIVIKCRHEKKIYRTESTLAYNPKDGYDWVNLNDYGEIGVDKKILAVIRPQNKVDEHCIGGKLLFNQEGYTWRQLKPIKMTLDEISIALGHRIEIKGEAK